MEISINITFKHKNLSQYLFNLIFYPVHLYDSNQRTLHTARLSTNKKLITLSQYGVMLGSTVTLLLRGLLNSDFSA